MAENSPRPLRAIFYVRVNNLDVSDRLNPFLTSITVHQFYGGVADEATIELSDNYGELAIPPPEAELVIELGWHGVGAGIVFTGYVDHVESIGGRQGRYLRVHGFGTDYYGNVKQPQEDHADNTTFGEAAAKFAKKAGLSLSIHSSLAGI